MTHRALIMDKDGLTEIGTYASQQAALDTIRELWMEDEEPGLIVIQEMDGGRPVATMASTDGDPEVCITCYLLSFAVEVHRCHYVLDANGRYLSTEVTEIEYAGAD